ncbi:MAG: sugar ABC transporter substrate-binding protein [Dorea sp.]|nr:sugar ABC transporter substrate-binding protein [Dorea sp.]
MKKKAWIVLAALLIGILALYGCKKAVGTPEDNAVSSEEEPGEEEEDTGYKFGFSAIDMDNPYFITLESAITEVLDKEGYTLITKNPESDPALQNEQIMEMIDEGIDAIFICPVNWIEITEALEALKEADIKIINVDTQVKEMEYVDAYIGSNNEDAGYICGEDLLEKRPEGGKILILECPTQNSINERITGFEKAVSSAEAGFEIVDRADTNGEFQKALEITQEMLKEHTDIDVIMCGNDQIAVGATTAVNLAGMKNVIIYGVDGSPDIKKELVKSDTQIAGTAAQSPIGIGKEAARTGIAILDGDEYEEEIYEDVFMINSDNVKMYGADGWQ